MEYRRLGSSEVIVSVLCFGCWEIGGLFWGRVDAHKALRLVRKAVDMGVTTFDTSDVYGNGRSEVILGFALKGIRDKVVIVTKVGYQIGADGAQGLYFDAQGFVDQRFDPDYLRWGCEQSLWRLRTDYIDVLLLHDPGKEVIDRDEPFEVLEQLKRDGKVRLIGVSSSLEACRLAVERGVIDVVQCNFNFWQREAKKVIFPPAVQRGIGIMARRPFAGGLAFRPEGVKELRKAFPGMTPAQAAIKFVLAHKEVSCCVTGIMRLKELREDVEAASSAGGPENNGVTDAKP